MATLDIQGLPFSHPLAGGGQGRCSGDSRAQGGLQSPVSTPDLCLHPLGFSQRPPSRMVLVHAIFPRNSLKIYLPAKGMPRLVAAEPSARGDPPPFLLQLLARVVVKEVRGWCGCIARKRGYVRTAPGRPPLPRCQTVASVPLRKDVCYPLLSLLHLRAGITGPAAPRLAPVGTKRRFHLQPGQHPGDFSHPRLTKLSQP